MVPNAEQLKQHAIELKLYGLQAPWHELTESQFPGLASWLEGALTERKQRGLERRLRHARIGRFKPLADFDWRWPGHIEQDALLDLMQRHFIVAASKVILIGRQGVGKSTLAQNLAYQAVIQDHSVRFTRAANLLFDLAAQAGDNGLGRLKHAAQPPLLVVDEVGYLAYSNRHADLLFEIINRRYGQRSTGVTTNRPVSEGGDVFPKCRRRCFAYRPPAASP